MKYVLSIDSIEYVLPKKKQSIQDVSAISGISVEELDENLGFVEKYITTDDETSLDLAEQAVLKLFHNANIATNRIDYIIFAHSGICNNGQIRSLSAKIQALIKADNAFCFEITNGCNSLNAALHVANSLLSNSNNEMNILLVVSDTLSKYVDYSITNIMHFYMYSDGAAAMLVNNYGNANKLISSSLCTEGKYADASSIRYKKQLSDGVNDKKENEIIPIMEATLSGELKSALYETLISNYIKVISECITKHDLHSNDIKFLFLAQNSKKIRSGVLSHFNYSFSKAPFTGKHFGHVGPIDSIIAFYNHLESGAIVHGDYVIFAGTGVGFHWGAHLFRV